MQALRDHFPGEGNVTRRIAQVDMFKESLYHKNKLSLTFDFFGKMPKMYNVYAQHGEIMAECAKIHFLFRKI